MRKFWPGISARAFAITDLTPRAGHFITSASRLADAWPQARNAARTASLRGAGLCFVMVLKIPRWAGWFGWLRGLQRKGLQVPHKRGPDVLQVGCAVQL